MIDGNDDETNVTNNNTDYLVLNLELNPSHGPWHPDRNQFWKVCFQKLVQSEVKAGTFSSIFTKLTTNN